ncbi:MAG: hypothetical protein H7Z13_04255 [Ferruginibacter sp.]|nr:hypothetical protein [Ferruginibacter sp.]
MKVKTVFKSSVIVMAFLCLAPLLKAQPGGEEEEDPDPNPPVGTAIPLDLGISALVAAGIGYAAKKRHDTKKKEKLAEEADK